MLRTLDTNICSYVLRRRPAAILEKFAALNRQQLWLSAIVAAELRFGAAKLAEPRFTAAVEAWLAGFDVQAWPVQATEHYARIRANLERHGNIIGAMDLLIAAHALARDSVLVTNNAREFVRVPGLAVEEWQLI
jgi:tRNA(fMet)-specific endonuclease VapC